MVFLEKNTKSKIQDEDIEIDIHREHFTEENIQRNIH